MPLCQAKPHETPRRSALAHKLKRSPRWRSDARRGGEDHAARLCKSSSCCRGAQALKILLVYIEEEKDSSAEKAPPLLLVLESSRCSKPITAHRVCPRDKQEFLAFLAAW